MNIVIPTYRLPHVKSTVENWITYMRLYSQEIPIYIFGDEKDSKERDFLNEINSNGYPIFYVGNREKDEFLSLLGKRLKKADLSFLNRDDLRSNGYKGPIYGPNRIFAMLYLIGEMYSSFDDDIRNWALVDLKNRDDKKIVLRGEFLDRNEYSEDKFVQYFNIIEAFSSVLGKKVSELSYKKGRSVIDSMMDLVTNNTNTNILTVRENHLELIDEPVPEESIILLAQAFRSGSPDIDAKDYVEEFLRNPELVAKNDASRFYVVTFFEPFITKENWRFDCGVAGYDNRNGLPPNIPTILRFEDYIHRVFLKKSPFASAHVNAVVTHKRNPYNRASLPHNLLNEEITAFLKPLLIQILSFDGLIPKMDYKRIEIDEIFAQEIIDRNKSYYERALNLEKERADLSHYYRQFCQDMLTEFCNFDVQELRKRINELINQEMSALHNLLNLWPDILEETKRIKESGKLPIRKISG
ncbi:MAG: hypothetical protein KQA41_00805 [Candidatus Aenigmarchaeota archaeon]|nr:hypothetical protein [Candidatus Aenigmarchaeota archaeon]